MSFIATLISHPDNAKIRDDVLGHLADSLERAINVTWLNPTVACDVALDEGEVAKIADLRPMLDAVEIDLVIQQDSSRRKSILIADMDSTMIMQECIDELADHIGIGDKVASITARAMRGEIDFEPALRERVGLLKSLPLSAIDDVIAERISLRSGGRELVQTMKAHGGYAALVSGGFTMFTAKIAELVGFDENRANTLLHDGAMLTGEVKDPILGSDAKVSALREICEKLGKSSEEVMAIGDGANDLGMIEVAGSGVAVHAKPLVAERAAYAIKHGDLTALLYMQGYRSIEFRA